MNSRIAALLDWASENDVNLDNAQVNAGERRVTFHQTLETRQNMRNVKRAVGNFETSGSPPYVTLRKELPLVEDVDDEAQTWVIRWEGGYECHVTYDCRGAKFKDEPEPEVEEIHRGRAA